MVVVAGDVVGDGGAVVGGVVVAGLAGGATADAAGAASSSPLQAPSATTTTPAHSHAHGDDLTHSRTADKLVGLVESGHGEHSPLDFK